MTIAIPSARTRRITIGAAVLGVVAALVLYDRLMRERPAPAVESDEEHFLHGSIGAEALEGVPYWIWLVLPRIVPDLLPGPGGYSSLGLLFRPGDELPVGISKVTAGYPRVAVNCAFCHTASVRTAPNARPAIVPGAPAHQTAVQQYRRFLVAAAADPRFNAATILGEIARNYRLSLVDRLLYRLWVIPDTRARLLRLGRQSGWMDARPDWGPGRADVLSAVKFHRLGQAPDMTIGGADSMPLWGTAARASRGLFWDGLHTSLQDAVVTSALSAGASRPWLDRDLARWDRTDAGSLSSLRRIQNYLTVLKPPAYPFAIDRALAAAGEPVYQAECARCHAAAGGDVSGDTGTDARRRAVWTAAASAAYDTFAFGRVWKASGFTAAGSYVPVPLDGLWLRAPYLHNGSVPSLADLLEGPTARPARFWRGYDLYDPTRVGFVSAGSEAERLGTLYDTTLPGNANTGHTYGHELPADSKRALLEYLKTL